MSDVSTRANGKARSSLADVLNDATATDITEMTGVIKWFDVAKGFGFKKLAPDIFEFRVDIHLRIAGIVLVK